MSTWVQLTKGKVSSFGGYADTGVSPSEGLSLIEPVDLKEWWFARLFGDQPKGTTGLARRLNPNAFYLAMRFSYGKNPATKRQGEIQLTREQARRGIFRISANGKAVFAQGADFGPDERTGRAMDLSPGILAYLGLKTDDVATAEFSA